MAAGGNISGYGYGLTARARELLVYLSERDTCPSFEEMQAALGLASKSGVYRLIEQLERRGYIRRQPGMARSIEIIQRAEQEPAPVKFRPRAYDVIDLPLHGRINGCEFPTRRA